MQRNGTDPVQRDKVPRQRSADNADVDQAGGSRVAEVSSAQIEKVDHEQQLGNPEVAAHPEVHEAEEQQVVGDEVRANVGSSIDVDGVGRVQGVGVEQLQNVEHDPVDGRDDAALRKRRRVVVLPEPGIASVNMGMAVLVAVFMARLVLGVVLLVAWRAVERVVHGRHEEQQPAHRRGDLVVEERPRGELIALGEGVQAVPVGRSRLRHDAGGSRAEL